MLCERFAEKRLRIVNESKAAIGTTLGPAIRNQVRRKFELRLHFGSLLLSSWMQTQASQLGTETLPCASSPPRAPPIPAPSDSLPQIPLIPRLNRLSRPRLPTAGGLHIISPFRRTITSCKTSSKSCRAPCVLISSFPCRLPFRPLSFDSLLPIPDFLLPTPPPILKYRNSPLSRCTAINSFDISNFHVDSRTPDSRCPAVHRP
jgi:hypothetical protein